MQGKILTSFTVINILGIASAGAYQTVSGGGLVPDTYVVSAPGELSLIPNSGNHADILINNGGMYSLSDLSTASENANQVSINFDMYGGGSNSMIILNADSGFNGTFDVHLINDVDNLQIRLTDDFLNNVGGSEILHFTNLTNTVGTINILEETESDVYVYNWGTCPGGTGICIMRSTSETYNTETAAVQHEQMVASIGVQNNPKMLLRPMMVVNQHELLDYYDFSDEFSVSIAPEYYISKDFNNIGIRLNSGARINGRLSIGGSLYAIKADFKNDVSDFESDVYGGNLRLNYDIDETLFVRGITGVSFASIDCDDVKNGNTTVNNPNAHGFYGGLDFGAKFKFESGLTISPFIGYDFQSEKVVDVHQHDSFLRLGNDIGFGYFMDGVTYSYVLRTGINSHGHIDIGAGIGIWTVSDKIGGTLSFGLIDTDFGMSGKISANVKFAF